MIRSVTAAAVKAISSSNEFRFSTIGIRSMGRRVSSSLSSRVSDWREEGSVVGVKDQASCDLKDPPHRYLKDAQTQNTSMKFPFVLLSATVLLACTKTLASDERSEEDASAKRSEEEASAKRSEEEASAKRSEEEASAKSSEKEASAKRSEAKVLTERSEEEVRLLYEEWFLEYRNSAAALDEKEARFQVFRDRLKYIDQHNAAADAGEHTHWLGLNCFADLTNEEVRSRFCSGFRSPGWKRPVSSSSNNDSAKPNRAFTDADGMHSSS